MGKIKYFFSIISCLFILLTTGCNKDVQILQTESDVYSYLKEHFPNETFKIINVVKEDIGDDACKKKVKGNVWTVYSETTKTTFDVYDTYYFNSFTCNYSTNNTYNKN